MPNYKTHLIGGLCTYALLVTLLLSKKPDFHMLIEWLAFCLIGSLFPDIDIKSKIQIWSYTVLMPILIMLTMLQEYRIAACAGILACLPLIVNHRGLFHQVWFISALAGTSVLTCSVYAPRYVCAIGHDVLFFAAGALSHIWLDVGLKKMIRI